VYVNAGCGETPLRTALPRGPVYDGEIWLELDDAKTIHLKTGDVVVQNGTRHAWRNKGNNAPVAMLFFLNGAKERRR
jgi:quercetin dioxygenase-like cupin family protein